MKPKRKRRRSAAPLFLLAAILMAVGAGAVYYVPIPGITGASPPTPANLTEPDLLTPTGDPMAERAADLARQEEALKSREEVVKNQESQVASLLGDLTAQQSQAAAVRKAVGLYTAMPPYKAAPLLAGLDSEVAVEILRLLDEDQAAAILAYMVPDQGAKLMRALAAPPTAKSP